MEYTIQKLARLAGISTRTLRYYDEIGLLAPKRINSSGYRIYGEKEVDALQQILFFKELGFELAEVEKMMADVSFNRLETLKQHLHKLEERESQIQLLIRTVKKTILSEEGVINMSDKEKFDGFKKELIEKNDAQYGKEVREKYGEDIVRESNSKMMNMSREEYDAMMDTFAGIQQMLEAAVKAKADPAGEEGKAIAQLHKQWLSYTWTTYSPQAHRGLGDMYLADERFKTNYDKEIEGCAKFLRDAIYAHVKD